MPCASYITHNHIQETNELQHFSTSFRLAHLTLSRIVICTLNFLLLDKSPAYQVFKLNELRTTTNYSQLFQLVTLPDGPGSTLEIGRAHV